MNNNKIRIIEICFYGIRFFRNFRLNYGISTLYLFSQGLTATEVFFVDSCLWWAMVAVQVPSGALGDRFGNKFPLVVGALAMPVGVGLMALGGHLVIYAVGSAILGVGIGCVGGSDSAVVLESLEAENSRSEFRRIEANGVACRLTALALGVVIGGWLAELFSLPLVVVLTGATLALVLPFALITPTVKNSAKATYGTDQTLIIGMKQIWRKLEIRYVFYFAVLFLIVDTGNWGVQLTLSQLEVGTSAIGIWFATILATAAIVSKIGGKIDTRKSGKRFLLCFFLLALGYSLCFAFASQSPSSSSWTWLVLGSIFYSLCRGLYVPYFRDFISAGYSGGEFATVFSVMIFVGSVLIAVVSPLIGFVLDTYGLSTIFWIFFAAILAVFGHIVFHQRTRPLS